MLTTECTWQNMFEFYNVKFDLEMISQAYVYMYVCLQQYLKMNFNVK